MYCWAHTINTYEHGMYGYLQMVNLKLEETGRNLFHERERSEALLYRMLPKDVARK